MKIVTWNAQGSGAKWIEIASELKSADFDIMLLQEVTQPAGSATYRDDYGDCWVYEYVPYGGDPWCIVYRAWAASRGGNIRCSLATLIRNYQPDRDEVMVLPGGRRPTLGVRPGQGMPWIFNLHATSGGGGAQDARDLVDAIVQVEAIGDYNASWVLAGDFNAEPDLMRPRRRGPSYEVCPPSAYTHPTQFSTSLSRRRKLDYALRSVNLGSSEVCDRYPAHSLFSDHYPQVLEIEAAIPQPGGVAMDLDP